MEWGPTSQWSQRRISWSTSKYVTTSALWQYHVLTPSSSDLPTTSSTLAASRSLNTRFWRCTSDSLQSDTWQLQWTSCLDSSLFGLWVYTLPVLFCAFQPKSSGTSRLKEPVLTQPNSTMACRSPTSSPTSFSWSCPWESYGHYRSQSPRRHFFPESSLSAACMFDIFH